MAKRPSQLNELASLVGSDVLVVEVDPAGTPDVGHMQATNLATSLLGLSDTDALSEGTTNLYYTDERAQDAVGPIIIGTNDATVTYSDATPSITVDVTVPVDSVAGKTGAVTLNSADVGLGNVPNEDATDPYNMDQRGASDGNVLTWDSTNTRWQPETISGGDDLSSLPVNAIGAVSTNQTIDLSANTVFEIEPTADITISATGLASSGRAVGYLTIINGGDVTLSFGSNFVFEIDSVPTFSSGTGFDLTTISYDSVSFGVDTEDTYPYGIAFNGDGTKMFMVGNGTGAVYQYSLTTGFDLSTASYDNVSFGVDTEDGGPVSIAFNGNGTKMFMAGYSSDAVHQYSLTTGFDLTTASYDSVSFGVDTEDSNPSSIAFNGDGTKMFMLGFNSGTVYQYSLTTGFDLSTAFYDNVSFGVVTEDNEPFSIAFNGYGTKMFMVGNGTDAVYQYSLTTGFDLSTAFYDSVSFGVGTEDSSPYSIAFNGNGTKMFMVGGGNDTVHQYSLTLNDVFDVLKLVQHSTDKLLASITHKGNT